jgi:hypothetical protein
MRQIAKIAFIVFMTLNIQASGQDGYMGKRFNFYARTRLCQAWTMANHNDETGLFKFDPWWSAGLDVTVNETNSFGAEYHFYNTRYPSAFIYSGDFSAEPAAYDDIKVGGLGIFWKRYLSLGAPMGSFIRLQLDYYDYDASVINATGVPEGFSSWMAGFQLAYGKTYIIHDYLTLTPDLSTGFAYGKGKIYGFKDELVTADAVSLADRKIRNMHYISLGLILGIIPF